MKTRFNDFEKVFRVVGYRPALRVIHHKDVTLLVNCHLSVNINHERHHALVTARSRQKGKKKKLFYHKKIEMNQILWLSYM